MLFVHVAGNNYQVTVLHALYAFLYFFVVLYFINAF